MRIVRRRDWELPECVVTPEHLVVKRRALLAGASALQHPSGLIARAQVAANPAFTPGGR